MIAFKFKLILINMAGLLDKPEVVKNSFRLQAYDLVWLFCIGLVTYMQKQSEWLYYSLLLTCSFKKNDKIVKVAFSS